MVAATTWQAQSLLGCSRSISTHPENMSTAITAKKTRISLKSAEKKSICELHKQNPQWTHDSKQLKKAVNRVLVTKS